MTNPYLVPCLVELRGEFNEQYPDRDKGADGWIADAVHSSTSDHQPDAQGRVRAIDIDTDLHGTPNLWDMCERLRRRQASGADNRLEYIIHMRKIASRTHGWTWRTYTGTADPHTNHAHFSARHDGVGYTDTRPWGVLEDDMTTKADFLSWLKDAEIRDALCRAVMNTDNVVAAPAGASPNADGTPNTHWTPGSYIQSTYAAAVAARGYAAEARTLAGQDTTDEAAIAAAVIAKIPTGAAIAAAIPAGVAQEVVDILNARLAS